MSEANHPTPDQRTPVDHLCVVCCKRTYENVGIQINGAWYCFTCGSKKRDGEPIQPTSKERTRRGHIMVLREILHHGTVETGAWEAAIRYAIHKLELQSPDETTASPQAPIARITVKADRCYAVELYTPGLPPGEHDLYCEPEAVAPMMREKRAYYETHDPPHCPTCDYGTSPSKAGEKP